EACTAQQQTEAVTNFLVKALGSPDPAQLGSEVKVADLLDKAVASLDQEMPDDPKTRSAILYAIGRTYIGLGLDPKAIDALERSWTLRKATLGEDDPDTLWSMAYLADTYSTVGRWNEAVALAQRLLALRQARLGPEHQDTLMAMYDLGAKLFRKGQLD